MGSGGQPPSSVGPGGSGGPNATNPKWLSVHRRPDAIDGKLETLQPAPINPGPPTHPISTKKSLNLVDPNTEEQKGPTSSPSLNKLLSAKQPRGAVPELVEESGVVSVILRDLKPLSIGVKDDKNQFAAGYIQGEYTTNQPAARNIGIVLENLREKYKKKYITEEMVDENVSKFLKQFILRHPDIKNKPMNLALNGNPVLRQRISLILIKSLKEAK